MHCASESTWKKGEENMSTNPFYSSIEWNIVECKKESFKFVNATCNYKLPDDSCSTCVDESCVNRSSFIEWKYDCNCAEACGNKKITRKQVKAVTVFNTKEKRLRLKYNEQFIRKDYYVNEHVGLHISKDKLPALFNECRNERMLHVMMLDQKHL